MALATGPVELPPPEDPPPVTIPTPPVAAPEPTTPSVPTSGPIPLDLEWRAPVGCPAPDRVVDAVAALLAREVAIDPTATFVVRGEVGGAAPSFSIELDVDGPRGTEHRRLEASTCELATDAAALVIATSIDPGAVARTLDRPAETPRAPAKPRANDRAPRNPPPPLERQRVGVELSLQGGPALGLAPKVTGWLQGGLAISIRRAMIGVHAGHAFARRASGEATLRAATTTGGVRGCFAPTQGRVTVPLCAIVELGAVTARAEGDIDRRARALWAGAGGGVAVIWSPHPRVGLVGGVDALVAITRPQFRATGAGMSTTYRVAPAAVRATLGIAVRLR